MHTRQTIRSIQSGDDVRSVFLIGSASLQQSRNGPYWRLDLRDATGSVEAKIWSPLSSAFGELPPGCMAEVEAKAGLFRDQIQLTVHAMRLLSAEEQANLALGEFMPASPRLPADMLAEIEDLCRRELTHKPWRKFALAVLGDASIRSRLLVAPAAKSIHHAYVGGLLEHMLSVAGLCLRMADHYPDLDRQTLFTGALFHDIGKLDEMSGGLVNDYTDSGRFLGHLVQGLLMLEPFLNASGLEPDLALHFRHLMASHHGEPQFGAARQPATAEAFVLHYADNVDAKVAQLRNLFPVPEPTHSDEGPADQESGQLQADLGTLWSPWVSLLERRICRPMRTPTAPVRKKSEKRTSNHARAEDVSSGPASTLRDKDERQCSLL